MHYSNWRDKYDNYSSKKYPPSPFRIPVTPDKDTCFLSFRIRITVQFYSSQVKSQDPSEIFPFSIPILITDSFEVS